jgi:hypothetical protein
VSKIKPGDKSADAQLFRVMTLFFRACFHQFTAVFYWCLDCFLCDPEDGGDMLLRSRTYSLLDLCNHLPTWVPRSRNFLPWRWRQYIPPKRRFTQDLHGATSQKSAFFIVTDLKTSVLTRNWIILINNIIISIILILYRPSDRRLSAKLVPTLADKGCRVVSATNPHSR